MIKRPLSVTIIAWLLIVVGGFFLITEWNDIKLKETLNYNTLSILLQFKLIFQLLLPLVSGIGMLKRQNWARYLYLICWIFFFVIYIVRNQMTTGSMGGTVLFLITVFFLFRPSVNDYFSGREKCKAKRQ